MVRHISMMRWILLGLALVGVFLVFDAPVWALFIAAAPFTAGLCGVIRRHNRRRYAESLRRYHRSGAHPVTGSDAILLMWALDDFTRPVRAYNPGGASGGVFDDFDIGDLGDFG